jgi:hypothetical protein
MELNKSTLFHEEQRFRTWILILLLVFAMLLPIGILFYSMRIGQANKSEFALSTIAIVAIEIPIFVFFYYTKLETIVTEEGLGYRWWPLQSKYRILFRDDMVKVNTRRGPILNYGIHWMPGYGWVHNVRGTEGLQIQMRSGKKLFIGSQKLNELKLALDAVLKKTIADYRDDLNQIVKK